MTERIKFKLEELRAREYRKLRRHIEPWEMGKGVTVKDALDTFAPAIACDDPIIFENDFFGFNFGVDYKFPPRSGNVTPNYPDVMALGMDGVKEKLRANMSKTDDPDKLEFGNAAIKLIDDFLAVADRHREKAKECGNERLYNALCKVPHKPAETFYEACVFMKFCTYSLRRTYVHLMGLGRFDQYMYPYYLADKARGVTDDEIFELVEAFFISMNVDTDLYHGIQQGDNGQSMMLGGYDENGKDLYNELSEMCMKASLELSLIDPKINLRINKTTPHERFVLGTHLTKQGLGFPQYCNDDIVIPGLLKLGYPASDAYNYTVAACWEFIMPGESAEVPNRVLMDFPLYVNKAITENLAASVSYDELWAKTKEVLEARILEIIETCNKSGPKSQNPYLSIFTKGCIENLADMFRGGCKYTNYGCHGAGIANAADALAAVKKFVFDEKTVSKTDLLAALTNNYEGYEELRNIVKNGPKMGNNDDYVDSIAMNIMRTFSDSMNGKPNDVGGIWRAGTGSAQGYIYHAVKCPATADGRKAFEPYASSYSPSLDAKLDGILSVIQSFTKYDLTDIINGGPLTVEIHDSVLRNDIGIEKVASLVEAFAALGGHQLQLNAVNRERLLDAQKHPENYQNLIVRVWGWSGYFNELDVEFQNHIIRRCEFMG